jgi:type IV secretion system protein VirD4
VLADRAYTDKPQPRLDDWSGQIRSLHNALYEAVIAEDAADSDADDSGRQRQLAPDEPSSIRQPKAKRGREARDPAVGDLLDVLIRARAINDGEHRIDNDILGSF